MIIWEIVGRPYQEEFDEYCRSGLKASSAAEEGDNEAVFGMAIVPVACKFTFRRLENDSVLLAGFFSKPASRTSKWGLYQRSMAMHQGIWENQKQLQEDEGA